MVSENKDVERHVVARLPSATVQKIPRTILQTFKTRRVPAGLFGATKSWLELNPEYEYRCSWLYDGFGRPPAFWRAHLRLPWAAIGKPAGNMSGNV